MSLQSALIFLGFICIFHLVGGVVVGLYLRQVRRGGSWSEFPRLVWGAAAGGLPMVIGASTFMDAGMPYLVAVEMVVFVAAIFSVVFFPEAFLESFRSPQVARVAFSGVFIVVGAVVAVLAFREGTFMVVLFGMVFVGVGALIFVPALKALFKP
ncbi:MAG: hypothetical protein HY868_07485 [Chloroflexi bacterium]|nr:hypothetical protein [Chloroflexota bacterium]